MDDSILVFSFSERTALDVAQRLRGERVYSLIVPGTTTAEQAAEYAPKGIILSGEEGGTGVLDAGILEMGVPVLALGHAAHMMLTVMGGACAGMGLQNRRADVHYEESALFAGAEDGERGITEAQMLMLPANVRMTASGAGCTLAFEDEERRLYGVQLELERNDPTASAILRNFAFDICSCDPWFTVDAAARMASEQLREAAEAGKRAVCAVSGGLTSTAAALLARQAFGERMTAVYVETGLMRESEGNAVRETCEALGIPLRTVDVHEKMLEALSDMRASYKKRRAVQTCLLEALEAADDGEDTCLVLGTDYSDLLFGRQPKAEDLHRMTLVEPLSMCFRGEIREIAEKLGVPEGICGKKPFPPLGLGALVMGEVRREKLAMLREIDSIFREELFSAGVIPKLYDFYPLLSEEGAFGGGRQVLLSAHTLSGGKLMPARLPYDVVERTVLRIRETYPTVTRVMLDETPATRGMF